MKGKEIRINEEIDARNVRCIDADGQQIGVISRGEALRRAEETGLDLVEVSPNAVPPVCKIMDFGKFRYELAKKEKESRKKQHVVVTKEIRLRPKTDEHDFQFKIKHARKFLEEGDRVKVSIKFRGRENAHREFGDALINRIIMTLEDIAKIEKDAKLEGGKLIMFLTKK